jgi:hypothetical protein
MMSEQKAPVIRIKPEPKKKKTVDLKRILEISKPRPVKAEDFVSGLNDDRNNCTFKPTVNKVKGAESKDGRPFLDRVVEYTRKHQQNKSMQAKPGPEYTFQPKLEAKETQLSKALGEKSVVERMAADVAQRQARAKTVEESFKPQKENSDAEDKKMHDKKVLDTFTRRMVDDVYTREAKQYYRSQYEEKRLLELAAPQVNYPNNFHIDEPFMGRMSRDLRKRQMKEALRRELHGLKPAPDSVDLQPLLRDIGGIAASEEEDKKIARAKARARRKDAPYLRTTAAMIANRTPKYVNPELAKRVGPVSDRSYKPGVKKRRPQSTRNSVRMGSRDDVMQGSQSQRNFNDDNEDNRHYYSDDDDVSLSSLDADDAFRHRPFSYRDELYRDDDARRREASMPTQASETHRSSRAADDFDDGRRGGYSARSNVADYVPGSYASQRSDRVLAEVTADRLPSADSSSEGDVDMEV